MEALRGSGIGLILGIENDDIPGLAATQANAASWVQTNIQPYHPDVSVMYVAVGNEVPDGVAESIVPAMHNIETALDAAGLADGIMVSTCIRLDVITNTFPPSMGTFAKPYMGGVAQFLATTGAPLLANVYPYFGYRSRAHPGDISVGTTTRDAGNGLTYVNLFDAMVDSVYAALEKVGAPDVSVVVSESGWPEASTENARNYNQGLIDHVGQGTPKRPGPLETYVFAMFNENQRPGEPTERNFGLFYPNKSPVYPITFR
jgi:hypothetical protein